jgi:HK97 family phage major capsid protein
MLNVAQLERDLEATRREGLALLESTSKTAEAENRTMTDEEIAAIAEITKKGQDTQAKIARAKGGDAMRSALAALTGPEAAAEPPVVPIRKSLGSQWAGHPDVADFFFRKQGHRTSSAWRSPSIELAVDWTHGNFMATTLTTDPASGGALIQPQYLPGILQPRMARLVVADLLASGSTDSNSITYMVESLFTNAAAAVAEGAAKPESALEFEALSEPVRKLAHWLPVTEEMLEDVPAIRSYIDARLRLGVQIEEEDQLLNGNGTAPNISGILDRTGLATPIARGAAESNADAIFRQIMTVYGASFFMPDGIVMNPADWVTTVSTKTSNGEYLTAGPFSPIQAPTLWGLPVVLTPTIVAATSLVGAFKQAAQVFRKGGIRVEASNSHQDFFVKNLVAIRAEERLALAVYRPGAFGTVTGLGAPTYAAFAAGGSAPQGRLTEGSGSEAPAKGRTKETSEK